MTSIEWLYGKMFEKKGRITFEEFEQAKEIHKQELFEYWQGGINCTEVGGKSFDQYYQETFVSKGSDDHISDVSKMVEAPKQVFTLDQVVMEAMLQISEYYADNLGKDVDGHKKALEIIQSLKQPKKD